MQPLSFLLFALNSILTAGAIRDGIRLGANATVQGTGVDSAGNVYIAGSTTGLGTIAHKTVFGPASQQHLFILKLDPSRTTLLYAAEFGSSQSDEFSALTVDKGGNAYLAGYARASDFPATAGSLQTRGNAFLLKLDPSGSKLVYATFLDTSSRTQIHALVIDDSGNAYLGGSTDGLTFPTTPQAFLRKVPIDINANNTVGFVTKLNPDGSAPIFSTLLGGTYDHDRVSGMLLAPDGTIHVTGDTSSKDFPVTTGFGADGLMHDNAFRARLDGSGSHLLYSSLLGGTNPLGIALDPQGNEWVVENVNSALYVLVWNANDVEYGLGVVAASTSADAMSMLPNGHLLLAGRTSLSNFPTRNAIMPCAANLPHDPSATFDIDEAARRNVFVMEIDSSTKTVFSSFLGGSGSDVNNRVTAMTPDPKGTVWIVGEAADASFPSPKTLLTGSGFGFGLRINLSDVPQGAPAASCLVDGVKLSSAPMVTGGFATLFGSNLGLDGTEVTVSGVRVPLLYTSDAQINFLVPQSLTGSGQVCVTRGPDKTCVFTYLTPTDPAIFYNYHLNVYAILNEDGTLNTPANPAVGGSYISLYGAGFGPYSRSFADGALTGLPLAALLLPVGAIFHDPRETDCLVPFHLSCSLFPTQLGQVVFSGAAPFEVNGLTQINVRTPVPPVAGTARLDLQLNGQETATVKVSLR